MRALLFFVAALLLLGCLGDDEPEVKNVIQLEEDGDEGQRTVRTHPVYGGEKTGKVRADWKPIGRVTGRSVEEESSEPMDECEKQKEAYMEYVEYNEEYAYTHCDVLDAIKMDCIECESRGIQCGVNGCVVCDIECV